MLGQVIAVGILEHIERITPTFQVSDLERALGNYTPGRFAWHFPEIYRLATPIPTRGMLNLWTWRPPETFWQELRARARCAMNTPIGAIGDSWLDAKMTNR